MRRLSLRMLQVKNGCLPVYTRIKLLSSMASDLHAPMSPLDDPHASGELDRQAFENMSHNALSVRFEINIVKVSVSCMQ